MLGAGKQILTGWVETQAKDVVIAKTRVHRLPTRSTVGGAVHTVPLHCSVHGPIASEVRRHGQGSHGGLWNASAPQVPATAAVCGTIHSLVFHASDDNAVGVEIRGNRQ